MSRLGQILVTASLVALVAACAAGGDAKAPSRSAAEPVQTGPSMSPSTYAPAPPSAPPPPEPSAPGGGTSRNAAMSGASNDLESSQRELDVAAGDCRNACRALGSMDRAAGRLCDLATDTEIRRCDDAKQKVYSARDRVKNTCGACPNGPSVDRKDPVPSKGSLSN